MQTLYVKARDQKEASQPVQIIRSFADASGVQIFLHANGVYGDKSGNPVTAKEDLRYLPPVHRARAEAWWDRIGKKMAEDYHRQQAEQEAARTGDFQEDLAEMNSELDGILYSRRAIVKGKPATAVTAPQPWMEFGFTARPDWWGQADVIAFKDFSYEILKIPNGQAEGKEEK